MMTVCNKVYKEHADARNKGFGDKTTVITSEIYGNAYQTTFIPILLERDDKGNDYLPSYIKSRLYVDFSNENDYEFSFFKCAHYGHISLLVLIFLNLPCP